MFDNAIVISLEVCLSMIILDTLLGIMVSLKNKTFSISKLPQFLASNVLPYVGGLMVVAIMALLVTQLETVYYAAAALVVVKFSKEALLDKLTELFK